jgi:hypothetical protein
MQSDIVGDELVGDELVGDDLEGDEIVGALDEDAIDDYLVGEDVGADDLLGEDDMGDDLVGEEYLVGAKRKRARARRRKRARAKALIKRAILAKRLKVAKAVHYRKPSKSRIQSIGFTRLAVPAGTSVEVVARPQELFRGTRLLVGSSIAAAFIIEDLKVGRHSQFVATGPQPAEAFRDTATGDNVALDTCKPGVDITLIVRNTTDVATDFRASLFGDVVE